MTLHIHRAERADTLAAALAELLTDPLDDVFAEEVVAVPARGIERWLTQRMSHHLGARGGRHDGICAAVRFPSPTRLLEEAAGSLGGAQDHDPWAPDAAAWPLLEVIDSSGTEPWCRSLAAHLGYLDSVPDAEHRRGRRYAVARRLAGLFDGYATHRPDMLAAWAKGADEDGWGDPVPSDVAWQPELWRRLRERIGGPDPVQRLAATVHDLRADPTKTSLPERLSLFGPTALPDRQFRVLTALAEHRDVHLWLPHPSDALWTALDGPPNPHGPVRRRADPSAAAPRHPLLSSLGRDAREMQTTLCRAPHSDIHHPADRPAATLLTTLQRGIAENERPGSPTYLLDDTDTSVQVHACHGPARQVDVLRDVLVGLLADDATLQPSDILVMCPDIEAYAPLVQGAFGLADVVDGGHPAHGLRVRLADRALTQTNPLLATVDRLLDLADGRVTASQVLDLAAWPPVRRRFGFDDDELEQLAAWAVDSGARWGLDARHRSVFGLQDFPQNTWRAGLDRVLLGVAMAEEDNNRLGVALPLDDVGSSDVDLAGRLAELMARVTDALDALTGDHTIDEWLAALIRSVDSLPMVRGTDGWQSAELRRELAGVEQNAAEAGAADTRLSRSDIRALLAGRLAGRPTRANFRTGTLTVCTMVPMRSVPHRVVCLLGLDDGAFPRAAREDGDNILAREPAVGERDLRSEDRQLMLDALMAATEKVIITYTGADERTGARRPPAVPLGELLDALDDTAQTAGGAKAGTRVVVHHPLQPFDPRTVTPGALGRPGPFTFDPAALTGARAAAGPRTPAPAFLPSTLPAAPVGDIDLAEMSALLTHPAKGFLRQRLDVAVRFEQDEPSDALPVELNALEQWSIGERLLRDRLAGMSEEDCRQAEWRRGVLPPGPLGARTLEDVLYDVRPLVERTAALRAAARRTVDVAVQLPDGRQVRGTVAGLHDSCLVTVTYSKLGPAVRLRAWIAMLALSSAHPETLWGAASVGRGDPGQPLGATVQPLEQEYAQDILGELVALYDRGLREPLPLPVKSAAAYAEARYKGIEVPEGERRAGQKWTSGTYPGEGEDLAHIQVWGRNTPFDVLLKAPPDDSGGERTLFGELAVGLWFPLLEREGRAVL